MWVHRQYGGLWAEPPRKFGHFSARMRRFLRENWRCAHISNRLGKADHLTAQQRQQARQAARAPAAWRYVQEVRSVPWYAYGTSTPANEAERLACTVVCAGMCVRNSQNRCEPKLVTGKRPAAQTKGVGARGARSHFSTDLVSFFAPLPRDKISCAARRHDTLPAQWRKILICGGDSGFPQRAEYHA